MMTRGMRLLEGLVAMVLRASTKATAPISRKPRKLLVMKLSGLGDAVMVRSLIEHMRDEEPALEIGVLGGPSTIEALSCGSSYRVFCYRPGQRALVRALLLVRSIRGLNYDSVIDFEQYSMLSAGFARMTGIPVRLGFAGLDDGRRGSLFTHSRAINCSAGMWENFAGLARVAFPALPAAVSTTPLPVSAGARAFIDRWLVEQGCANRELVVLHLGAALRMAYRRWPQEYFVEVGETLRRSRPALTIVLTGVAAESELVEAFRARYMGVSVNATHLGSLERTCALLLRCRLLLSNDTGVMHLGAAMGVRTLGLFGPSNPAHWAPTGPRASYLYSTSASCSPCIDVFHRKAPIECSNPHYQQCLHDLKPVIVLESVKAMIGEASSPSYPQSMAGN